MKRPVLILLMLWLLAALCACEQPSVREAPVTAAPTTEAPRPVQTDVVLALDGSVVAPVYQYAGASYAALPALCDVLPLTAREDAGTLRLELDGTSMELRDGSDTAASADGGAISLGAAVLRSDDGWYLPVAALEALSGRTLVRDKAENVLFCLRVEDGPTLFCNGAEAGAAFRCDGILMLRASQLAALCGCSMDSGTDEDGTPVLTLCDDGRSVSFRSGSLQMEQDGTQPLPVPAWQDGDDWFLPANDSVRALGGTLLLNEKTDRLTLWIAEDGPLCYVSGTCLGATKRFGDCLCGDLSALAEAVGGQLKRDGSVLELRALGHSLLLHPGNTRVKADAEVLTLPVPVLPQGDGWLVPLEPVTEVLGLPVRTDEAGLVFSRMEPCETLLFVDGVQTPSYTSPEGGVYVRVRDVLAALGGSFVPIENEAALLVWGRELDLRGGDTAFSAAGEELELSVPAVADGSDWYAPASELLPAIGLSELIDPELDQRYYTHIVKNDAIPKGYRVPILMYHAVSDSLWGIPELFVSPDKLEAQIQAMLAEGYTPITFEDLDRVDTIPKPVMLTFDDGYDNNYTELFPLLQKYNVKATIFVIVEKIDKRLYLTEEQIKEMSDSGLVSIQSHTMSHGDLDLMYDAQLRYEHYESMLSLTRLTGRQPFVLCYPTGKNSYYSRLITEEYYEYGLNMGGSCYVTGDAPYRIYRSYISRDTTVEQFLEKLAS